MAQKRIVVMNGQRLTQESAAAGQWSVVKVDKAGSIKPGVYNLGTAKAPSSGQSYTGAIVQADRQGVFQSSQLGLIRHETAGFSKLPEAGSSKTIAYNDIGKITISDSLKKTKVASRGRSL